MTLYNSIESYETTRTETHDQDDAAGTDGTRRCDYPRCNEPTTVQDVFGNHFCASDHLTAARNEWNPDDLERFDVEYDGISGTFRAPSQEQADTQWRAIVYSRRRRR